MHIKQVRIMAHMRTSIQDTKQQHHSRNMSIWRCMYMLLLVTVQVIIEGFKSYKDQTIVEPFSRNINVVGECRINLSDLKVLVWSTLSTQSI
jgi:hypothetical protein